MTDTQPLARLLTLIAADPRQQKEVAAAAGMSAGHLNQIMRGRRQRISFSTAARLLVAIGKKWADLDPA